ncbi:hypothetical protein [Deinococcus frigens]|uniref:hypothetical protein n=1 Tax=Deinococcus frigens TaxID=249403 RepID=UPI0012EBCE3B|nr:hypothetical protein [Deinococcus frigens]
MKWSIRSTHYESGENFVRLFRVESQLGGIWKSTVVPVEFEQYDIEIDIDLHIEKLNPIKTTNGIYRMSVVGGENRIIGLIEDVDEEDNLHYLRISIDGLIMIESSGLVLNKGDFYILSVPLAALEITPLGRVAMSSSP